MFPEQGRRTQPTPSSGQNPTTSQSKPQMRVRTEAITNKNTSRAKVKAQTDSNKERSPIQAKKPEKEVRPKRHRRLRYRHLPEGSTCARVHLGPETKCQLRSGRQALLQSSGKKRRDSDSRNSRSPCTTWTACLEPSAMFGTEGRRCRNQEEREGEFAASSGQKNPSNPRTGSTECPRTVLFTGLRLSGCSTRLSGSGEPIADDTGEVVVHVEPYCVREMVTTKPAGHPPPLSGLPETHHLCRQKLHCEREQPPQQPRNQKQQNEEKGVLRLKP